MSRTTTQLPTRAKSGEVSLDDVQHIVIDGMPEIWRYDGRRIVCLHLQASIYRVRQHSLAFPFLEPAQLLQFLNTAATRGDTAAIKAFVAWVRKNGWTAAS
jgi:hypothetical protein